MLTKKVFGQQMSWYAKNWVSFERYGMQFGLGQAVSIMTTVVLMRRIMQTRGSRVVLMVPKC